ncbi:MAG: hypothetical protein FJ126_11025 [Deltaproteobacteria bacterium]|nr:hypothetical protein [Deltaproteobacteria bacterium]
MIKKLFEKLESLEKEIAAERGDFSVFGLFLREDAEDRWDLVVAAPWLNTEGMEDLNYITNKLKSCLKGNELVSISRIVLLDLNNPIIQNINQIAVPRGGSLELTHPQLYGLPFKSAYIIISKSKKPVLVNVGKRRLRQSV